ncbi:MAG: outer membrane beta-barrel protein [Muribaculaceae bacterium]|nr:outer membrane beta-barrel protein [Muribaculaceae bacterium]
MRRIRHKSHVFSGLRLAAAGLGMACAVTATAQTSPYKFDFGAALGMSGYIGDANRSNVFKSPGFDGELSMRYIGDSRWAVRGVVSTFGLSGSTDGMADILPDNASYSFTSQVYELSVRGEFNFFAYGIGETYKRLRRWTPYITVGIGGAMASSGGNTAGAFTIPMGLGLKFKLRPRLNLGVEFSMTKAFSDHFDGPRLSDLNQIKTAFYKNTDWYSRLTVGITYEFGERCETCHYVD